MFIAYTCFSYLDSISNFFSVFVECWSHFLTSGFTSDPSNLFFFFYILCIRLLCLIRSHHNMIYALFYRCSIFPTWGFELNLRNLTFLSFSLTLLSAFNFSLHFLLFTPKIIIPSAFPEYIYFRIQHISLTSPPFTLYLLTYILAYSVYSSSTRFPSVYSPPRGYLPKDASVCHAPLPQTIGPFTFPSTFPRWIAVTSWSHHLPRVHFYLSSSAHLVYLRNYDSLPFTFLFHPPSSTSPVASSSPVYLYLLPLLRLLSFTCRLITLRGLVWGSVWWYSSPFVFSFPSSYILSSFSSSSFFFDSYSSCS